jgi:hypothetical protein
MGICDYNERQEGETTPTGTKRMKDPSRHAVGPKDAVRFFKIKPFSVGRPAHK